MNGSIEERIVSMGLQLPILPTSKGIYKSCLLVGNLLYVSGHVSVNADGSYISGKLGKDLKEAAGKDAARQCGLAILSTIKKHYNLDKIRRVIKLLGMVNATPEFEKHPVVINGCSELFARVWGDDGIGVRSAVGFGSLPDNIPVEIEAVFELEA